MALKGAYAPAVVLAVVGLWLAGSVRRTVSPAPGQRRADAGAMSQPLSRREAQSILGVGPDADEAEIKAAYLRLIRLAHPDRGGTEGLAAQLNAARDRLLSDQDQRAR